jgi:hypothetical protein
MLDQRCNQVPCNHEVSVTNPLALCNGHNNRPKKGHASNETDNDFQSDYLKADRQLFCDSPFWNMHNAASVYEGPVSLSMSH